jgi:ABC-type dipeptide/oligopeptide/nickel transport system permease component
MREFMGSWRTMLDRFKALHIHRRIYLIAAAVLAAGLIACVLIIHFAPPDPDMSYLTDGADLPVPKDVNRQYQFQVERIGGQEGLLAAQFNDWFTSLWQGRQLGYTVFCIAAAIALVCAFFGKVLSVRVKRNH